MTSYPPEDKCPSAHSRPPSPGSLGGKTKAEQGEGAGRGYPRGRGNEEGLGQGTRGKEKGEGREKVGEERARHKDKDTATLGARGSWGEGVRGVGGKRKDSGNRRRVPDPQGRPACMIREEPEIDRAFLTPFQTTRNPNPLPPSSGVRTVPESHNTYGRTTLRHRNFNAVGLTRVAQ